MSFQQGLSGLDAASKNLDIIGNNIANATTVGFKASTMSFGDVYANSLLGADNGISGIGVGVTDISQDFSQGNISVTSNPLDMAINGSGFFRLSDGGDIVYSRNGQFHLDKNGYIVNAQGANLTGYQADGSGNIVQSGASNLRLTSERIEPRMTSEVAVVANLNAREQASAVAFDVDNPATYHATTSLTTFDSQGNPHAVALYFVKTAPNIWDVYGTNDGTVIDGDLDPLAVGDQPLGQLAFLDNGQIDTANSDFPVVVPLDTTTGAVTPYNVTVGLTGTTQFGSPFGVTELRQNGFADGSLTGFAIDENGVILSRYSNGQSRVQGQVLLSTFANPNGLQPLGNNVYAATSASGQAVDGPPLSGNAGALQAGVVEDSNVDLTQELVNMITAQRVYQSNAQTIKTQDQVLQTMVNLR